MFLVFYMMMTKILSQNDDALSCFSSLAVYYHYLLVVSLFAVCLSLEIIIIVSYSCLATTVC